MHSWVDERDASRTPANKEGASAVETAERNTEEETETGKVLTSPTNRSAAKNGNNNNNSRSSSSSGKGRMTSGGRLGCPVLTRYVI